MPTLTRISVLFAVLLVMDAPYSLGQTITNPGFESGTTGWSSCPLEINSASVYGGPGSNKVAEVDGHNNAASTADDRLLCQTISGFTVGAVYLLEFDATRRPNATTPNPVSVTVSIVGAASTTVTRSGGWNMVRERILFAPTATSHQLRISPNFTVSYGMLFDNFSLIVASPLPVELVHFDASPINDAVELRWATASERNNAGFVVERSADLIDWERVSEVHGAGDSQTMNTYATVDRSPLEGVSYYRLKQIDLDGTEDHYGVRSVTFTSHRTELAIWPNPATDKVHVRLDGPEATFELFNGLGQAMVVPQERSGNAVLFDIASLPTGSYHLVATGAQRGMTRFFKE
ncbi:MAG: hypothetical protein KDC00_07105 [Flavobacteriales bacterium]|nr:hypothetical protein [Flavobacteriales bacterium]